MQNSNTEVSIIIVSWNVKKLLEKCLLSLRKYHKDATTEIIVIDNASSDGSVAYLKKRFPDIKFIENKENLGFTKANNIGIQQSSGNYILLLNPDTLLIEDSIKKMKQVLDEKKKLGALGCKLIDEQGNIDFHCATNFPTIFNLIYEPYLSKLLKNTFESYTIKSWDHKSNRDVDVISGACFMVRRKVLKQINYLDEYIFIYVDDVDLCYRIKKAGYDIYYFSDTSIIHYGMQSVKQNYIKIRAEAIRSMRKFFSKRKSVLYGVIYEGLIIIDFLFKFLLLSTINFFKASRSPIAIRQYFIVALELITHP